ncbi:PTS mannose/fructose/sorbose/N-acetylgalactosamine transporter subunit IIC [Ktedonosporobacter rubrisoli]|uniref:PTS mannose/fructose/sorbose/N-acetylgalactosamine transporter subunit IIC n=1 Tax=Ktedonosporobacter rubrisoli TaxID=2509675 RepID=UPI001A92A560|nr:PTS sugar transporter subunit IIC [Ktedonosporobacter rubrisoli]
MESYSIVTAIVLAVYAYIAVVLWLGPGLWFNEPLVAGLFTGLIVGNVPLGLAVGGTLTLYSLGQWTYGGSTIPDVLTGSIVGTAIGALASGNPDTQIGIGLAVGFPTALLMTQMDVLGRAVTTIFIHGADRYAEDANEGGINLMHLLGQLPWGITRAIPVFLAIWLGSGPIKALVANSPAWLTKGIHTAGLVLPALGFALLFTMLPIKKYWPFLIIGFVLYAYLNVPVIAIALLAVAIGFILNMVQTTRSEVNV